MYFRPTQKNQVAYIRERDVRGEDIDVSIEEPMNIETKNPEMRFFKYHKGYTFQTKTRFGKPKTFTRFLAKEGTAFLWKILGFDRIPTKFKTDIQVLTNEFGEETVIRTEIPIEWKAQEINLDFETVEGAVINRIGKEAYNTYIIPELQAQLQNNHILCTVGLEPGLTPKGFNPISEIQIWKKAAARSAEMFAGKIKDATKTPVLNFIPWIGLGFGIALTLALFFGWIQLRPA